jgi:hypothetical protein
MRQSFVIPNALQYWVMTFKFPIIATQTPRVTVSNVAQQTASMAPTAPTSRWRLLQLEQPKQQRFRFPFDLGYTNDAGLDAMTFFTDSPDLQVEKVDVFEIMD